MGIRKTILTRFALVYFVLLLFTLIVSGKLFSVQRIKNDRWQQIEEYLSTSNVQLGATYDVSRIAGERVAAAARAMATFINAPDPAEIIMGSSTTLLMRILSICLGGTFMPGDEVIVTNCDHEANIGPWTDLSKKGIVVKTWRLNPDPLDLHLEEARRYGRDMLALQLTPQAVLDKAMASPQPLQTFLAILDQVGAYKEDPLRKKSLLLAMLLNDRPERFLVLRDDEKIAPIIDYHFVRLCLRIGLIDVLDEDLEKKLTDRRIVSPAEEWAVRYPAYLALEQLITLSGRSLSAVNGFLFSTARNRCLEMAEPECQACTLDTMCAHRKAFFQPVLRTTFY